MTTWWCCHCTDMRISALCEITKDDDDQKCVNKRRCSDNLGRLNMFGSDRPVGSCEELTVVLRLAKEDGAGAWMIRRVEIRIQLCHKHREQQEA